jgi:DNA-binding GntR family transcriptional regulator
MRGVQGGVVVHEPDERMTARTAAMVLQSRGVALADVYDARSLLELTAVRVLTGLRSRRAVAAALGRAIADEELAVENPTTFGQANARFHDLLVELAGNQTLTVMAEMLNELVGKAVIALGESSPSPDSLRARRRGIHSQERLVALIEAGDTARAEEHWRKHLTVAGRVLLGSRAESAIVDLTNHY